MAFNGSGTFNRVHDWTDDEGNAIDIEASRMDEEHDGFATGLSNCVTKDGQTTVTANLPMSTYRHTGVGNASARDQYAVVGQIQDSTYNWIDGGGTADAITATYSPAVTALVDGMLLCVRATAANATTTPTFAPNGLTAYTIVKQGGSALAAGDIVGDGHELLLRYDLSNTRWELLNPAASLSQLSGDLDMNGNQITSPDGTDLLDIPNGSIDLQTASTSRLDITDSGVRLGAANARVTTILDEDTMSSDSATALATQQSIKAYVDTNDTSFKFGSFTYDLSTASGTQAITGVGFQPDRVEFFGAISGGSSTWFANGCDDGTNAFSIANNPTTGTVYTFGSKSIAAFVASADTQIANITTFGADGFTLTWTKAGSPTGTLTVYYKAYKN